MNHELQPRSGYPLSAIRYPLSAIRYPLSAIRFPPYAIRRTPYATKHEARFPYGEGGKVQGKTVLSSPHYLASLKTTVVFSLAVTFISMCVGLFLAVMADTEIRGATVYKTLLLWPYAIAPAVAAVLWLFIFHPSIGFIGLRLREMGIAWDYKLHGSHALLLVIIAASWKQVSYNFAAAGAFSLIVHLPFHKAKLQRCQDKDDKHENNRLCR